MDKSGTWTKNGLGFREQNRRRAERTVALTQRAIAKLEADGEKVTLSALVEASRTLDEEGKGLAAKTIVRNAESRKIFHQHSPAYQQRQQQRTRVARRRSPHSKDLGAHAAYRGLHAADLIAIVEELKQQVAQLKLEHAKLEEARDEACRLRDEALQQNRIQLGALTRLTEEFAKGGQTQRSALARASIRYNRVADE